MQAPITAEEDVAFYLRDKDAVLVPKAYEKYFSAPAAEAVRRFHGQVVECYYEMDEGSLLYLKTKIERLLGEKTI